MARPTVGASRGQSDTGPLDSSSSVRRRVALITATPRIQTNSSIAAMCTTPSPTARTASYREYADGPYLTAKAMAWFWDAYTADPAQRAQITALPLREPASHHLPHDPRRDVPGRIRTALRQGRRRSCLLRNVTVLLVHGAFAESASWNPMIERLRAESVAVVAVANPLRSVSGDAAYLRDVITGIGTPVVLVGHSYGGMVITEAAADNGPS